MAVSNGDLPTLRELLAAPSINVGAQPTAGKGTPLFAAITRGDRDIIRALLKAGADIAFGGNDCDVGGAANYNALHGAATFGDVDLMRLLLFTTDRNEAGNEIAPFQMLPNFLKIVLQVFCWLFAIVLQMPQATPSQTDGAVGKASYPQAITVRTLSPTLLNARINITDDVNGATPLYLGASGGTAEIVDMLVSMEGIDVNAADTTGRTPLYVAAEGGFTACVASLLGAGADPFLHAVPCQQCCAITPLLAAVMEGKLDAVRLLLPAMARRRCPAGVEKDSTAQQTLPDEDLALAIELAKEVGPKFQPILDVLLDFCEDRRRFAPCSCLKSAVSARLCVPQSTTQKIQGATLKPTPVTRTTKQDKKH